MRGAPLRLAQVESLLRVVERRLADESLAEQVDVAAQLGARVVAIELGLAQRLLGHRCLHLAQLAQPRLRLCDGHVGLRRRCLQLGTLELEQHLPGDDALAFADGDALDVAHDLGADRDTMRRLDVAAGDDRLHEVALHHRRDRNLGSQHEAGTEPGGYGQGDEDRQRGATKAARRLPPGAPASRSVARGAGKRHVRHLPGRGAEAIRPGPRSAAAPQRRRRCRPADPRRPR